MTFRVNIIYYGILFIVCWLYSCNNKPGDYIRKAKKALENENAPKAVFYFQKAYESSLDKSFLLLSKIDRFSKMEVSGDKKHIVLLKSSKNTSKFVYKVFDGGNSTQEVWENLEGEVKHSFVSFDGSYVLFTVTSSKKSICKLIIWRASDNKFIKTINNLSCENRAAISSRGLVLFMKGNKIWSLHLSHSSTMNTPIALWVRQTPDKPFKNQRAKATFSFSSNALPFMTYGIAGTYKLYNLANRSLILLTKRAGYYQIFFTQRESYPGVITGGASQRKFTFFHFNYPNRIIKQYDISTLMGISFVKQNEYYSIESNRLYLTKNGKSTALPFFVKNIFAKENGGAFFLSSIGTPLHYEGIPPNRLSRTIFTKILEIEESK